MNIKVVGAVDFGGKKATARWERRTDSNGRYFIVVAKACGTGDQGKPLNLEGRVYFSDEDVFPSPNARAEVSFKHAKTFDQVDWVEAGAVE